MSKEDLAPTMVDMPQNPTKLNSIFLIHMYKEDLALNNLQGLTCQRTKLNYSSFPTLQFFFLHPNFPYFWKTSGVECLYESF